MTNPNDPMYQEAILQGGTLGGAGTDVTRPDYPESEHNVQNFDGPPDEPKPFAAPPPNPADTVRLGEDTRTFGTNDSIISDDAMGPVNVPWPTPDYAPPEANEPDDGWGPEAGHRQEVLPPGSFRGAVHMSDPQCKPMGQSLLGQEDFR